MTTVIYGGKCCTVISKLVAKDKPILRIVSSLAYYETSPGKDVSEVERRHKEVSLSWWIV